MDKSSQLEQFDSAYSTFVEAVRSLDAEQLLQPLSGWTPRDIVAHLIGWNYNIRSGCEQIMSGSAPFYHVDGPNDYRRLNAEFMRQYNSTDLDTLLRQLEDGRQALRTFLGKVDEQDWARDFGPQHYRGGPATVGRCAASITGDYIDHAREISTGIQDRGRKNAR